MPFVKGQSGNPSGRPKKVLELVEMARHECPAAIEKATELLGNEDAKVAMAAAVFLRDTGMGRPSQVDFDLAQVTDEALSAEIRRRAELARARERTAQQSLAGSAVDAGQH